MTSSGTSPSASKTIGYAIVVRRELSASFAESLLGSLESTLGVTRVEPGDGITTIVVEVIDQAHLLAILERLRDLAVEIERVNPAHEDQRKPMTDDSTTLPEPSFAGGTRAITTTPVVGTPRREYAEMFVPGEEELEDGEMRVTVLGSGNPWVTRAQSSGSVLVEIGNAERDLFILDLGSGSLANYASLKLPVNKLDKVFFTHLHADHTADLITLSGSYSKVGRADRSGRRLGPERYRAAPGHPALRRVDPGGARLGQRGQPRPDQPGQPRDDGDRVRLPQDPGRLRGETASR